MLEPIYLAATIAISTCIVFGVSNHVQHLAVDHMDVQSGTLILVATPTIMLWLLSPLFLAPETLLTTPVAWFALAGLIVPSLSMTFQTLSVRMLGPGLTAGLASTSPVFAMILAVTVLGEMVSPGTLAGTAIVVGGIAFIALRARGAGASWPLWAIAVPLGAALTRGLSHNIVKHGLDGLPSPMTAALVGSTVSMIVLSTAHLAAGRSLPAWNVGYGWFALCGILNGIGLVGLSTALAYGEVVVVAPLVATTPVFTLLIGWLFFRRETVTWSTIAAIAIIIFGCLLVILR